MSLAEILVLSLSVLFTIAGFASLLRYSAWWIRMFDFPRLQISVALIAVLIASIVFYSFDKIWHYVAVVSVAGSLLFELSKIFKYTFFVPKQVLSYSGNDNDNMVSIMVSNVLQSNRNSEKLIQLVKQWQPDMLLTLETDSWWEKQLEELNNDYPFSIKKPQNNLYGMLLVSRLKLSKTKIAHLVEDEIPSFEAYVELKSGESVKIFCLHPKPPFPDESKTSTNRDAELLLVAKNIKPKDEPVLIFGDFNDVAWSHTTKLFQKTSGLLDPRIGRGFFNTFHAEHTLIRWPLDHTFHSSHFKLVEMKRLGYMGSDHFPIFVKLHFDRSAKKQQEEPVANAQEEKQAQEKIQEAT